MKMRIASLSLLTVCCLMLAVAPAMAGTAYYNNGPYNGTNDAWTINFGFTVSDSYNNNPPSGTTGIDFVYWDVSANDIVTTVDVQFGSTSFTGPVNTLAFSSTFLGTNQFGFNLFKASWTGLPIPDPPTGFVTLGNACSTSGCSITNPIYWDENSGPSTAYENTLGSIPSEAFTLYASNPSTPEPSSIMLFGSGILGLAGVLRRRLMR